MGMMIILTKADNISLEKKSFFMGFLMVYASE